MFERCDVRDTDALMDVVERHRPDAVVHLASPLPPQLTGEEGRLLLRSVLASDRRWMERIVRTALAPKRLLVVGSAAEYGMPPESRNCRLPLTESDRCHPSSRYGELKHGLVEAALQIGARSTLDVIAVRPFNVVGAGAPRGQLLGDVIARSQAALGRGGGVVTVDNLGHKRDFLAVDDVAAGIVEATLSGRAGQIYNLCSGRAIAVRELLAIVAAEGPPGLSFREGRESPRPGDVPIVFGSPAKARRTWGFAPKVSLREAVRSAWEQASAT